MSKITVFVYYRGYDSSKDSQIRALGTEAGGRDVGSGYCFSSKTRDLEFWFKNPKKASAFVRKVKRIEGVKIERP